MAIMKPSSYVGGNACKLSVGNHLLYLHMSSHYRRICNAKCTVDTSPPCAYKLNHSARRRRHHHTNSQSDVSSYGPVDCELGLARNIANDAKQSSHTYSGCTWTEQEKLRQTGAVASHKQQHQFVEGELQHHRGRNTCRTLCRPPASKESSNYCRRVPLPDIMDQHAKRFTSPDRAFRPRILKTETQSRLHDSRVYHPASRKIRLSHHGRLHEQQKLQHQQSEEEVMSGRTSARCSDLCDAQKHVSSKESSHDSAYNGGTSSSAESRGPTPVVMCPTQKGATLDMVQLQRKEDAAYVKFVHDITEDVLARGIYSDRGLQQLFQRHLADNEGQLNLDRMKEEVGRLCEQLGILQTDCGGELFQVAQRSEFLSQETGYMQKMGTG
ncbi:spermatogenesis-associated protein 7-like isoform X2 [Zootermopsis nevadensis]|uniref:spermatogenesis-associated protein 7-like isoform X2 n=1 Tax=Zootermopsis nevadensis TaxID=136037 RepID=UPI000B8E36C8|nr:spermatogenesis-associated protein 7-like isoform X2 [Zootermopsis nevadensis]